MSENVPSLVLTLLSGVVALLGVFAAGSVGVVAIGLLGVFAAGLIRYQDLETAAR